MNDENETPDEATSSLGAVALLLFLVGILGPIGLHVMRDMHSLDQHAIVLLGGACELLALGLGAASWKDPRGRVAAIGAGILVIAAAVLLLGAMGPLEERGRRPIVIEEHERRR